MFLINLDIPLFFFIDKYQLIFASEESLKKINQKILSKYGKEELKKQGLDDGLSMDRFRASFFVSLGDNPSAKNAHFEDT